jgi:hypothetical protein
MLQDYDEDLMRREILWLGLSILLMLGVVGQAIATVAPPYNQCPGDCSPCLGVTDPFCDTTPDPTPQTTCWACHWIDEGNGIIVKACDTANAGEDGHTGCKEDLPWMASCTFSGTACKGQTTTP